MAAIPPPRQAAVLAPRQPAPVRHAARLGDAALAVLTVVGVFTGAMAAEVRGAPWDGLVPFVLFLGGLMFVRRRLPMTVLLLSIVAIFVYRSGSSFEGGWIWPASAAYFSAATTRHVRWVTLIGVAQLGYAVVGLWPAADWDVGRFVTHIAGEGLLLVILIAGGLSYASVARWRERLQESDGRARDAEERLRVSREVHDIVAHTLAVVGVQLNVAADTLQEAPDEAAAALRLAQNVRNRAMADLASLIGVLRDGAGDIAPQPDLAALHTLAADARAAGLDVVLDERGDPSSVPAAPAVAVHRVVQEALTNTLKHARASKVEVTVEYGARIVTVEVADNGRGGHDGAGIREKHGLIGMWERVSALGGCVTVGPVQGGFAVRAEIPVAGWKA
ncbi:sensor histidine kinase [Nonomuraea sp. SMC257]|uniref:histidine kinase n=1 Tax=Nonomuraea montanisoli TaxID=2741721 RepID=A0A7Y6I5Z4_9ACTN|nr:sensor histidine kinase [Nonomuraea montanisoli]NUW32323.1 sensor histidine kinase [Nonomuraea montanisoli]